MLVTSKINKWDQSRKSDRQLRTGLKFKDIEFGGFVGYSVTTNDVYTPSGVERSRSVAEPTEGRLKRSQLETIVELAEPT